MDKFKKQKSMINKLEVISYEVIWDSNCKVREYKQLRG